MKIKLLAVFLCLCFISCKKDMESDLEAEVIKVNLDGTELYTYSFGDSFPVEGGWEIKKQAENYLISEMNWTEYQYQAKEGFKGIETVEIVLSSSIGDNNFIDQKKWIFEIRVK